MTGPCYAFKFLQRGVDRKHQKLFSNFFAGRSVNGKHLMRFQSETFFKFLRGSVDFASDVIKAQEQFRLRYHYV